MTPKCPVNKLVVQLDSAYNDKIVFESGVVLYKDTSFNPEWQTTCVGKIVSVPDKIARRNADGIEKHEYRGVVEDARVGDEVIFSYMVIEDKEQRENDTPIHKNQFYHQGEYYWLVDYMHVLGYIREEKGEYCGVNVWVDKVLVPHAGYVFLKDVEKVEEEKVGSLYIPEMSRTGRKGNRAEVISVGQPKKGKEPLSIEKGDIIIYNDRYAQRYELPLPFGKIIVLPQEYVAGVERLSKAA